MAELKDILKNIGNKIKYYRKQKGWSQGQLAAIIDKDRQIIQRIETGLNNPTIKTLHSISDALGVKIEDIIKE